MGKKPVESFVRAQVVALYDAGFNQVHISKHLKISWHRVQNAIKKYKETGNYDDLKRIGCLKKILDRAVCHLKRLVK